MSGKKKKIPPFSKAITFSTTGIGGVGGNMGVGTSNANGMVYANGITIHSDDSKVNMPNYDKKAAVNILEAFGPFVRDKKLEEMVNAEVPPQTLILYAQPVIYKTKDDVADPECQLLLLWRILTYREIHPHFESKTGGFDEKLYEWKKFNILMCGKETLKIDDTIPSNKHMLVYIEESQNKILGINNDDTKQQ